ncbi:MAG: hypothetical protein HZB26_22810 [Candidatus Hydrogenedentes bacterium]|nr:hypothetical protein [Candidatus Hydrogenedentota bacterium]
MKYQGPLMTVLLTAVMSFSVIGCGSKVTSSEKTTVHTNPVSGTETVRKESTTVNPVSGTETVHKETTTTSK